MDSLLKRALGIRDQLRIIVYKFRVHLVLIETIKSNDRVSNRRVRNGANCRLFFSVVPKLGNQTDWRPTSNCNQ